MPTNKHRVQAFVDDRLLNAVKCLALQQNSSVSAVIEMILKDYFFNGHGQNVHQVDIKEAVREAITPMLKQLECLLAAAHLPTQSESPIDETPIAHLPTQSESSYTEDDTCQVLRNAAAYNRSVREQPNGFRLKTKKEAVTLLKMYRYPPHGSNWNITRLNKYLQKQGIRF